MFPNAKINLGLNVLSKRKDGFHNIETVLYPVGWSDALEVIESEKTVLNITGLPVSGPPDRNLVLEAYTLLKNNFDIPPVNIHLHKVIPMGAGLGGGSSDAACMLKLLNNKFDLRIGEEKLEYYARMLGSDCPFFIQNHPVRATGKGDTFSSVHVNLKGYFLVIIFPDIPVGTGEAYAGIKPEIPETSTEDIINMPVSEWSHLLVNDFTYSVFKQYPLIKSLQDELYKHGALYANMSGSGSAVYGIFSASFDLQSTGLAAYMFWTETL